MRHTEFDACLLTTKRERKSTRITYTWNMELPYLSIHTYGQVVLSLSLQSPAGLSMRFFRSSFFSFLIFLCGQFYFGYFVRIFFLNAIRIVGQGCHQLWYVNRLCLPKQMASTCFPIRRQTCCVTDILQRGEGGGPVFRADIINVRVGRTRNVLLKERLR